MPAARSPQDATPNNQRGTPALVTQPSHSSSHNDPDSASSTSCHIPRPPNAFLIFRSEMIVKHKLKDVEPDQRNISRIVGLLWNDLPEEQKSHYRQAAETRKLQYQLQRHDQLGQPAKSSKAQQTQEDKMNKARQIADSIKHETEHLVNAQERDSRSFREPVARSPPYISQDFQNAAGNSPSSSVPASSNINHASTSTSTYYPPSFNNISTMPSADADVQAVRRDFPISDNVSPNFEPQYDLVTGDEDLSEDEFQYLMESFTYTG